MTHVLAACGWLSFSASSAASAAAPAASVNDIVETAAGERHWGFALDLAKKDIALAAALADAHGFSIRYGELTRAVLESCGRSAPAGSDLWRLVEDRARETGVSIL